jgi:hypothetical protein
VNGHPFRCSLHAQAFRRFTLFAASVLSTCRGFEMLFSFDLYSLPYAMLIAHLVLAVVINWLCQNSINESFGFGFGPLLVEHWVQRWTQPSLNCPEIAAGVSKC